MNLFAKNIHFCQWSDSCSGNSKISEIFFLEVWLNLLIEKNRKTLILIGPEGDFSKNEVEIALQERYKTVSLGTSRMRTETAGIVAVNTISINQ